MPNETVRLPARPPVDDAQSPRDSVPDDVVVIGVGNDLRGDDGAGRIVIGELARIGIPGLRTIWSHQLVPELVEPIAAARLVVFVDADTEPDTEPDTDTCRAVAPGGAGVGGAGPAGVTVRPIVASPPSVGGHQADPAALLGLARRAGLPVPAAFLVSVPGHDFGVGTQLSPLTRAAVPQAVQAVLRLLGEFRAE